MYGRFAGTKKCGHNNEVAVRRGLTVYIRDYTCKFTEVIDQVAMASEVLVNKTKYALTHPKLTSPSSCFLLFPCSIESLLHRHRTPHCTWLPTDRSGLFLALLHLLY